MKQHHNISRPEVQRISHSATSITPPAGSSNPLIMHTVAARQKIIQYRSPVQRPQQKSAAHFFQFRASQANISRYNTPMNAGTNQYLTQQTDTSTRQHTRANSSKQYAPWQHPNNNSNSVSQRGNATPAQYQSNQREANSKHNTLSDQQQGSIVFYFMLLACTAFSSNIINNKKLQQLQKHIISIQHQQISSSTILPQQQAQYYRPTNQALQNPNITKQLQC